MDADDMHEQLERFVEAQEGGRYRAALAELRDGRKRGHWIWFVLPQLTGLGHSPRAIEYGIRDLEEAKAYIAHDELGPNLVECMQAIAAADAPDLRTLMGSPTDAIKLHSCVTLFVLADPTEGSLHQVLARWFDYRLDNQTLALLARS